MLFLLLFAAWLLTLEAVLFLRLRGLLGFLQLLLFEGRQTGLGAAGVLVGVVALFLRFGGRIPESGRRICQTERSRLQMLLVSQYTSTANGMATPEKMYTIGNIHSIIFCIISVCLFAALWAMLRFMLLYCMSHRQKHINATKMPMTHLAVDVGGGEVLGHVHAEHVGGGELLGGGDVEGAEAGTVPELATGDVWNGRQGVEHAHEHRTLHEHRQHRRAAAHRVRVVVLVELHHLALQSLFAGGSFLPLYLFWMRCILGCKTAIWACILRMPFMDL